MLEVVILDPEEERARVGVLVPATAVELVTHEVITCATEFETVILASSSGLVVVRGVVLESLWGALRVVLGAAELLCVG